MGKKIARPSTSLGDNQALSNGRCCFSNFRNTISLAEYKN